MAEEGFHLDLQQQSGYRFKVTFDQLGMPPLLTDEPPPLGENSGPNPVRLLGTSIVNCMAASLLFSLRKYGNEPGPLHATADVKLVRNERGRLRVPRVDVLLQLGVPWRELKHAQRALAQYEDFCVVTQSVRGSIDVVVRVLDSEGAAPLADAVSEVAPA
jgi:organic hydroperoxide reductase OsmC/OhrA